MSKCPLSYLLAAFTPFAYVVSARKFIFLDMKKSRLEARVKSRNGNCREIRQGEKQMGKMNRIIEDISASKKFSSGGEYKSPAGMSKSEPVKSTTESHNAGKAKVTPLLTHKQIEERAKAIWQQKGCPVGQDEKNWFEAEAQLKKELISK
jgi:hypothetical protein